MSELNFLWFILIFILFISVFNWKLGLTPVIKLNFGILVMYYARAKKWSQNRYFRRCINKIVHTTSMKKNLVLLMDDLNERDDLQDDEMGGKLKTDRMPTYIFWEWLPHKQHKVKTTLESMDPCNCSREDGVTS